MNTAVVEKNNDASPKADSIFSLIEKSKKHYAMALGRSIDPDQFVRVALTALRTNSKLMNCNQQSLLAALMTSAQLGLAPDGVLGQAYLVPYGTECVLIVGWKGLVTLATRSGHVRAVRARIVYENDEFSFEYGMTEKLIHKPAESDRGEARAVYAVAEFENGGAAIEVLFKDQVESHRDQYSKSWRRKDSAWQTAPLAMWQKTAIRKICTRFPMSSEAQRAIINEDRMANDLDLGTDDILDVEAETVPERPSGGVGGLVDAIEEKDSAPKEEEALPEVSEEMTMEAAMASDCREAIEAHLKEAFSVNLDARLAKLKFYVAETIGSKFSETITGLSDLDDTMVPLVWKFIESR